jgi:hypothetical protein
MSLKEFKSHSENFSVLDSLINPIPFIDPVVSENYPLFLPIRGPLALSKNIQSEHWVFLFRFYIWDFWGKVVYF